MSSENSGRQLQTIKTSLAIIDALQELDGARVTELGEHLDLSPSTVQGHINTLTAQDYLVKEGDIYHLSLQFLDKGGYVRNRKHAYNIVMQKVESIAEETEERVQFIVNEGGLGYYIHTVTGTHAVQVDARIGKTTYLHASAAGKSILSHLPEEYIDMLVATRGLPKITENTITDKAELLAELEEIRERGTSYNMEESIEGLCAVGVPVLDETDQPIGGLSISGPSNRMEGSLLENKLPDLLLGAANEIELNIAYPE
jgi:DNA-binding IclR family transcriptional regulator